MKIGRYVFRGLSLTACAALALFVTASRVAAQAPEVIITSPAPNEELDTDFVKVFLVARANVGDLAVVNVKLDDGSITQAIPLTTDLPNGWVGFYVEYTGLGYGAHTFKAFPVDSSGAFGFDSVDFEVIPEVNLPPTVPSNLRFVSRTDTSVTLAWGASYDDVGVDRYKLRYPAEDGHADADFYVAGNVTEYTITGLSPYADYRFKVKAFDAEDNASAYSAYLTLTGGGGGGGGGNLISDNSISNDGYGTKKATTTANTIADADKYNFYMNDFLVKSGIAKSCEFNFLQGGSYTVTVEALNGASVLDAESVTFNVPYTDKSGQYNFRRLNDHKPIVDEQTFKDAGATLNLRGNNEFEYSNIQGPCVINVNGIIPSVKRVKPWANYYMYFASHHGQYIRMAYSASIEGPWTLYNVDGDRTDRGVLTFGNNDTSTSAQLLKVNSHITLANHMSSPEILVVDGQIILYFHSRWILNGVSQSLQKTFAATSVDNAGLDFNGGIADVMQLNYYAAMYQWNGNFYGSQNQSRITEHPDNDKAVQHLLQPANLAGWDYGNAYWITSGDSAQPWQDGLPHGIRHIKLDIEDDTVFAAFSCTGDSPERLYYRTLNMADNVDLKNNDWECEGPAIEIARAEAGWEGGHFSAGIISLPSFVDGDVNQLRDPDIFIDNDGRKYIFYSGEGESAIGVGELFWKN